MEAERNLPQIPAETSKHSDFFNPSRTIVKSAMSMLDLFSNSVAQSFLESPEDTFRKWLFQRFQHLMIGGSLRGEVPQFTVGVKKELEAYDFTHEVIRRYQKIAEATV